mgnify:CR=1 FL=1
MYLNTYTGLLPGAFDGVVWGEVLLFLSTFLFRSPIPLGNLADWLNCAWPLFDPAELPLSWGGTYLSTRKKDYHRKIFTLQEQNLLLIVRDKQRRVMMEPTCVRVCMLYANFLARPVYDNNNLVTPTTQCIIQFTDKEPIERKLQLKHSLNVYTMELYNYPQLPTLIHVHI